MFFVWVKETLILCKLKLRSKSSFLAKNYSIDELKRMTVRKKMKKWSIKYSWEWRKTRQDFAYLQSIHYISLCFIGLEAKEVNSKWWKCGLYIGILWNHTIVLIYETAFEQADETEKLEE